MTDCRILLSFNFFFFPPRQSPRKSTRAEVGIGRRLAPAEGTVWIYG